MVKSLNIGKNICKPIYRSISTENQTPSYSAEVELEGNKVNSWPYIHALLCSVSCLPRETKLATYYISTSTRRKHVEVR